MITNTDEHGNYSGFIRSSFRGFLFRFRLIRRCAWLWRGQFFLDLLSDTSLSRIIGHVPAFTLELHRRGGDHLLQTATAFLTTGRGLVRELLKTLNRSVPLCAFEF